MSNLGRKRGALLQGIARIVRHIFIYNRGRAREEYQAGILDWAAWFLTGVASGYRIEIADTPTARFDPNCWLYFISDEKGEGAFKLLWSGLVLVLSVVLLQIVLSIAILLILRMISLKFICFILSLKDDRNSNWKLY